MQTIADEPSREIALVYVRGFAQLVALWLPDLLAALTRSRELAETGPLPERDDKVGEMIAEIPSELPVLLELIEVTRTKLAGWLESETYEAIVAAYPQ